jgi:hypothetical protein
MSNQNNRVLIRIGARILTPEEETVVVGGISRGTTTVCSAPNPRFPHGDGDPGECGF